MIDVPFLYAIIDKCCYHSKTYGGYKKNDVINIFQNSLINNKLEESCKWFIELNITGYNDEIWIEIIYIITNYINISNLKIIEYIYKKFNTFYKIYNLLNKKQKIHVRNNQEIRNLLSDVVSIVCLSNKKNLFNNKILPKINIYDFEKKNLKNKIKSTNLDLILEYTDNNDDNYIKIAINEIAYHLRMTKDYHQLLYWYFWIKKSILEKKKRNQLVTLKTRNITNINIKYLNHWIWFLWDIIINEINFRNEPFKKNIIEYLFIFYKFNFKPSYFKKKESIILFIFYILTHELNLNLNLINNNYLRIRACANINYMYLNEIKNNNNNLNIIDKKKIYKANIDLFKKKNIKKKVITNKVINKEENLSYLNDLLLFKKKI